MLKLNKKQKSYFDLETLDYSSFAREMTEDEFLLVNGGAEVENSNEGVANAKPGDSITRNDGTSVTLTQGDIDYAQNQISNSTNTQISTETSTSYDTASSNSKKSSGISGSSSNSSSSSDSHSNTNRKNLREQGYPDSTEGLNEHDRNKKEHSDIDNTATNGSIFTGKKTEGKDIGYEIDHNKKVIKASILNKKSLSDAADMFLAYGQEDLGYKLEAYGEKGNSRTFLKYSDFIKYEKEIADNEKEANGYFGHTLKTLSKNKKANSTYIENNQEKTDRFMYFESDRAREGNSYEIGVAKASSKTLTNGPAGNLQVDFLTASVSEQYSDSHSRIGFGVNILSANWRAGISTNDYFITIGAGLGLGFSVEAEKSNNMLTLSLGPFKGFTFLAEHK